MLLRYHKVFFFVLLCAIIPGVIIGHTFYLLPDRFVLAPGKSVKIYRYMDDRFPAQPENWDPGHIVSFHILSRLGTIDMAALKGIGRTSAPEISFEVEGNYLLAYVSKLNFVTLRAENFEKYLKMEGLDHIIELRKREGQTNTDGREQYSRYAKVLLQVGQTQDGTFSKVTGQKLEIVPEQNPYKMKVGDKLNVRILFEGKPLENALVSADNAGSNRKEGHDYSSRTDKEGKVSIPLTAAGPWLVRLVHMVPIKDSKRADWESFWGSLTFAVVN